MRLSVLRGTDLAKTYDASSELMLKLRNKCTLILGFFLDLLLIIVVNEQMKASRIYYIIPAWEDKGSSKKFHLMRFNQFFL